MKSLMLVLAAAMALALPDAAPAQTATDLVAAADQVRNPDRPFRSTSVITEYVEGKPRSRSVVVVYGKEDPATRRFRNLVRYAEPARDAGKLALFDRRALWFYDPASKASVRISPQQRLAGQASIGDVLNVNLAADYAATLGPEETVRDGAGQPRKTRRLDLRAKTDEAIYSRIDYWLEVGTNHPIRARFYSDSGRPVKLLYYRNYQQRLGRMRPAEAVIVDAVNSALVTTVAFSDIRFQDIPEAWFQRDYLPRLKAD